MNQRIYLDNNASTKIDPRVIEKMHAFLRLEQANPSSIHKEGRLIHQELITARDIIAQYLSIKPKEIIFTSCGTESLNLAIRGILDLHEPCHVISSDLEHSAVYNLLKKYASKAYEVTFLKSGACGKINPEQISEAIRPNTRLIALMATNNETGVKTDFHSIAKLAQEASIPFIVDGVALMGKELFTIPEGVTAMGFSAHKFHGPQGAAFLYLRAKTKLSCQLVGGGHEANQRSGTENMLGIIALAKAVSLLSEDLPEASLRMEYLRDQLEQGIMSSVKGVTVNGSSQRTTNTSNLSFENLEGESLLMHLDQRGISASHGSACSSGTLQPSRVLLNMSLRRELASSAIRFSLSRMTTEEEIKRCIEVVSEVVKELKLMIH